jgi:hypothetical protein
LHLSAIPAASLPLAYLSHDYCMAGKHAIPIAERDRRSGCSANTLVNKAAATFPKWEPDQQPDRFSIDFVLQLAIT